MSHILDCRDLACPEPVLRAKDALEQMEEGILDIQLNSFSSIQNIKRYAKNNGLYCQEKKEGKMTVISIVKGYACDLEQGSHTEQTSQKSFWALIAGSIITAILASTCCLGPLLFLLFGVSAGSIGFLKVFAPYHDLFSLIAVSVIGYLWYHYFRVIRKKIVCEGWICKYYLLYLLIGTVLVAILLSYQYWVVYLIGE
jgi:TusA-related sulfurtransferase